MAMSKRPREPEWTVRFEDTSGLKHVVEAASAVMTRVIFQIKRVESYYCLHVDGADVGFTCCVSARLRLDKVLFGGEPIDEFSFCVDAKQVLYTMDAPSCARAALDILGYPGDASVMLHLRDPDQISAIEKSTLNTFVDSDPPVRLDMIEFKVTLEIDLVKLRELIKKSHKAHAEKMGITVYTFKRGSSERSLVTFWFKGDTEYSQIFCHETTKDEDGSLLVRAAPDGSEENFDTEDETPLFQGVFPIDRIEAFIKTVMSRMLVARAMTGMPLLLHHPLGDSESHVRFLVAPIQDEN